MLHQMSFWVIVVALPRVLNLGQVIFKEGKSAINLSNLGIFCQIWPRVIYLKMLGRSAVPKIIYVRTAGGAENTSNIGENPNINNLM